MIFVWALLGSLLATIIFDFVLFKIDQEREVEKSWQALNEQLEREGRPRLDQMNRDDEGK
jgi:hypothetical protein